MSFIKISHHDRFEEPNDSDPKLAPVLYRYEELNIGYGLFADGLADIDVDRHGDWFVLRVFPKDADGYGPGIDDSSFTTSEFDRELFKLTAAALRHDCAQDIEDECLAAGER